jgi:hypothetical protein
MSDVGQDDGLLLGIAVGLTPFDVVGSAASAAVADSLDSSDGSVACASATHIESGQRPSWTPRTKIGPRVSMVVGVGERKAFQVAAVGLASVVFIAIAASHQTEPSRAVTGARHADVPEPASPVSAARTHADKPMPFERPPVRAASRASSKERSAEDAPRTPPDEGTESMAATLERLQRGIQ